jgi:hypothetical protein
MSGSPLIGAAMLSRRIARIRPVAPRYREMLEVPYWHLPESAETIGAVSSRMESR